MLRTEQEGEVAAETELAMVEEAEGAELAVAEAEGTELAAAVGETELVVVEGVGAEVGVTEPAAVAGTEAVGLGAGMKE